VPPPGLRCFIHRDYHPENTLWSRDSLTGVVDWTSGSWGPAAVDAAHMRWNLALTYGLDAADEFLRLHRSLSSDPSDDQHYWDLVTVLDLVFDLDPNDWPRFDLERLERYVESVLARAPWDEEHRTHDEDHHQAARIVLKKAEQDCEKAVVGRSDGAPILTPGTDDARAGYDRLRKRGVRFLSEPYR
jgi:Ser/Thr protein kinase RdoA (MazF antagonist)